MVAVVTLMLGMLSWIINVERTARADRREERLWKENSLRKTRDSIQMHAHRIAAGDAGRMIEVNYQQLIRIQRQQLKDLDG